MLNKRRQLAIRALSTLAIGAAGCGSAASTGRPRSPDPSPHGNAQRLLRRAATQALAGQAQPDPSGTGVRFRVVEYAGAFINAGSPHAFSLFATSEKLVNVAPTSSAHIVGRLTSPPRFASPLDRRQWHAAGSPRLPFGASTAQTADLAAGTFSFIPVGTRLTFYDAQHLPASPMQIRQALEAHLRSLGRQLSPSLMLRAYGFLLPIAPLGAATRAAIFTAIESLPGLHASGTGRDLLSRVGETVSVDDAYDRIELLLAPNSGSVLAVQQRVLRPQPAYPGIRAGTLIESVTFVRGS